MQIFPNPDNPIWTQANTTDLFGNLYATRNINLERAGYIGVSRRMKAIETPFTAGHIVSIVFAGNDYKAVTTSGTMVSIDPVSMTVTAEATTGANNADISSDIVYWNNTLYYSNATQVRKLTGGVYSQVLSLTTSSYTIGSTTYVIKHPICLFNNKVLLAVGDGNIVRTINESDVIGTTLTLPKQYIIDWIRYFGNKLYIGTRNTSGGDGSMFVWDGSSSEADSAYPYYSSYSISGVFFQSTLYLLNLKGQLLQFTGGGFNEVARFPFYNGYYNTLRDGFSNAKDSMVVYGDQILIGIGNTLYNGSSNSTGSMVENFYSGIWAYDKINGLSHKFSPVITTNIATPTEFGSIADSPGIYIYPLVESSYLAFGVPPLDTIASRILASSASNDLATVLTNRTLNTTTTGEARGYFQTRKVINTNTKNSHKKIYVKYRNVTGANDKIIVKYKEVDKALLPSPSTATFPATWVSTSSFSGNTFAYTTNVSVGDEVEILHSTPSGAGSSILSHITSIVNTIGNVHIVSIDETITGVNLGVSSAIKIDNFKKLATIDSTTSPIDQYVEIPIDVTSKWISIKVEMRGEDVEIEQLILVDDVDTPAV